MSVIPSASIRRGQDTSARALQLFANSEVIFYNTRVLQLRNEVGVLWKQVKSEAHHRLETVPDIHGNHPTGNDLLFRRRYVSQQARYTIHNTLLQAGQWALITRYLGDIVKVEEEVEEEGEGEGPWEIKRKEELMSYVKSMVEEAIAIVVKGVWRGIVTDSRLGRFWTRDSVSTCW